VSHARAESRPTSPAVAEGVAERVERAIREPQVSYVGGSADLERVEAARYAGRGGCGGGRRIAIPSGDRPDNTEG
jgi:hypothetical protein